MITESPNTATESSRWSANELIPFGKYLLLDRISVGATAAVYRAKSQSEAGFERLVAIKRILPHMAGDADFTKTFVQEAKTAARLSHTNICPIFELGKVGESLYMAMEYVAGKDLGQTYTKLAKKGEPMPPVVAAWIASKLCDALDYAHNLKSIQGKPIGILHRDLSPANILISYEGQVKLIDFGVAKAMGQAQQTNVDALKRKLSYMSPEMVKGKRVDHRSDVFGVGVCLYEMITSKRLFAEKDDISTLKLVSRASVPPPSAIIEDPPEELEMITMRALERDPDDRWQSGDEMNGAIQEYIAKEHPAYGVRQLSKWIEDLFESEIKEEQERLNQLLQASELPNIVEERKRFFTSPTGAAAVAKAEVIRRMSSAAPAASWASRDGAALPSPAAIPSFFPPAAGVEELDEEIEELDIEEIGIEEDGGGEAITARPGAPAAMDQADDDEEDPTEFFDARGHIEAEFDEDATEIYFNKEEGVGLHELFEEDGGLQAPAVANAAGSRQPVISGLQPAAPAAPVAEASPQWSDHMWDSSGQSPLQAFLGARPGSGGRWLTSALVMALSVGLMTFAIAAVVYLGMKRPTTASMEIRTYPQVAAVVLLDGVERGRAPLRMDGVPVGSRRLEIRADGYQPIAREVHLTKGATAILDVSLVPSGPNPQSVPAAGGSSPPAGQASSSKEPSSRSEEGSQARPSKEGKKASTTAASGDDKKPGGEIPMGTVAVIAIPWSEVYIDGKKTGRNTPIESLSVPAGPHEIGLRTKDGRVHVRNVVVEPGKAVKVVHQFD